MKTQELHEAKMLESQRDTLRSELSAQSRWGKTDQTKFDLLMRLDKLFFIHCDMHGIELSKFGRIK